MIPLIPLNIGAPPGTGSQRMAACRAAVSTTVVAVILGSVVAPTPASAQSTAVESTPTDTCTSSIHFSNAGDDSAATPTEQTPWKNLTALDALTLTPGTCVLLKGGETFEGSIYLDPADAGSATAPVTIGSYGSGSATLSSGERDGIFVYNTAGVHIRDLVIFGSGYDDNTANGINVFTDLPGATKLTGITIDSVEVAYYGGSGILIGAFPADGSKSGFADVTITDSAAHDNADAGVQTYGAFDAASSDYSHGDVSLKNVSAYHNVGRPDKGNNSGNGIVLGDVDGALVEHSIAFDNGERNNWPGGGPVGIWAYDANDVTLQYNESYANKSGTVDGGGFDLDGGVTNSVMQYNYSHDNEGAGYLVFQYEGARPLIGNVVRYNISQNDGRDGKYGGITIGSYGSPATDTDVYGNTVYMSKNSTGSAAGIRVWEGTANARFFNNAIKVTDGIPVVSIETNTTTTFQGNNYDTSGTPFLALVGGVLFDDTAATQYTSLAAWRAGTGAEYLNGRAVGSNKDSKFVGSLAQGARAFILRPSSKLIGTGLKLTELGVDAGGRDYFGVRVPLLRRYSIGAAQL